ncbi:hypothetical protein LR948_10900 [Roseivivax sp. GX 12232]|uniref:hypothetical protein n=1 Tax=Roseivivax sp. GX 12232 TaxID=2900547 RepID=UPI001E41A22C|nr:hypothetical protein [Roseivivax sp. GX 12232]MCE0505866.1 hypothetical protein [Roseivivax sp. GX 12232]
MRRSDAIARWRRLVPALALAAAAPAGAQDRLPGGAPEPSPAGEEITNRVIIEFGPEGSALPPIEAESTITVLAPELPGELTAFRVAGQSAEALRTEIAPADYSVSGSPSGPFDRVPRAAPAPMAARIAPAERVRPDEDVIFLLEDPLENTDPEVRDAATLRITDSVSGDSELLRIYETGKNTATFAGAICACSDSPRGPDGVLATEANSRVMARAASARAPDRVFEDSVTVGPVTPRGRVFDSRSGTPLNGARITIIDAETGAPAEVFGEDLEAPFPATVTSGGQVSDASGETYDFAPGSYRFPYVEPGSYVFVMTPPEGYLAPSSRRPEEVAPPPGGAPEVTGASYLKPFDISPGEVLVYDIPLDGAALVDVSRSGSAERLTAGEAIRYTATVGGSVPGETRVDVTDLLPEGLKRVPGSLRIDGARPEAEVTRSRDGRQLVISDMVLPEGRRRSITYTARVTVAAPDRGTLTSRTSVSGESFNTASAQHRLEVGPAFARDESAVLGEVVLGCGPAAGPPERDLSGIRIMLENGRFAETDARGRFTLRRVPRGGHVLALDRFTLPRGLEPVLCRNNTRRAGAAGSVFLETRDGFARRIRFHLTEVPPREAPDPEVPAPPRITSYDAGWLDAAPRRAGLHFPPEGFLPPVRSLSAAVVRQKGQTARLFLNGTPVPEIYRRPAVAAEGGGRFLDIWRGAELDFGVNDLRLEIRDASGTLVRQETRQLRFTDRAARLEVLEEMSDLSTDGRARPLVVFRATDAEGTPLHPGAIVAITVERPFAFAPGERLNGARQGAEPIQRTTASVDADGRFRMRLAPSRRSGLARFTLRDGERELTASAPISAADRDWTAAGLVEARLAGRDVARALKTPGDRRLLSFGDAALDGHAALFLEGIAPGGWHLTLRYDSAIDPDERDFFAEDPERDYLVYGDESTEGDAASSRSPLYLRLERGGTDLLWGDFDTAIGRERLAEYDRRLTGARASFTGETQALRLFAAETSLAYAEDRFPADGTTGPFDLKRSDILPNSESLTVETTARDDPTRVIARRELTAGRDYSIDYVDGRIFLARPLRARTPDLDRNTLVVRYETETARRSGVILGARYEVAPTEDLSAGVTLVHEDDVGGTTGAGQLGAVDARYRFSETLTAHGELALSRQGASNLLSDPRVTHAAELGFRFDDGSTTAEGYLRSQSTGFGIANLTPDPQRIDIAHLSADLLLSEEVTEAPDGTETRRSLRFQGQARLERNAETGETLEMAEASLIRSRDRLTRSAGLRYAGRRGAPDRDDGQVLKGFLGSEYESADGRLRLAFTQELTLWNEGARAEADLGALSVDYALTERLRLTASNEVAWGEDFRVDILAIGAELTLWEGARLSGGLVNASGRDQSQTVGHLGFDQALPLTDRLSGYFGLEAQDALAGDLAETGPAARGGLTNPRLSEGFVSASAGLEHAGPDWRGAVDAELGFTTESDHARLQLEATTPLSEALSLGAHASFFWSEGAEGALERDHEIKLSAAWRPFDRPFVLLNQFSARREVAGETDETRLMNELFHTRELSDRSELSLRHGLKHVSQSLGGGETAEEVLTLVGAEYRRDLTDWLDLGLHGASLWAMEDGSQQGSAGVSLGFTPFENGWIALGYNVEGFADPDFSEAGYTDKGAFLQFRFKIDQDNFNEVF